MCLSGWLDREFADCDGDVPTAVWVVSIRPSVNANRAGIGRTISEHGGPAVSWARSRAALNDLSAPRWRLSSAGFAAALHKSCRRDSRAPLSPTRTGDLSTVIEMLRGN